MKVVPFLLLLPFAMYGQESEPEPKMIPGADWSLDMLEKAAPKNEWRRGNSAVVMKRLPNGNPFIVYRFSVNGDSKVKFGEYSGNHWKSGVISQVDNQLGRSLTLAMDPNQRPAATFSTRQRKGFKQEVFLARFEGKTWDSDLIYSKKGRWGEEVDFKELAFTPYGNPAWATLDEVHQQGGGITPGIPTYKEWDGKNFTSVELRRRDVRNPGRLHYGEPSMTITDEGTTHIAYLDLLTASLIVNTFDGSSWKTTTVDSGIADSANRSPDTDASNNSPILHNPDGDVFVAYVKTEGTLNCARYDGETWRTMEVDPEISIRGVRIALGLDKQGNPTIAYYDTPNRVLKFAYLKEDQWVSEVVCTKQPSRFNPKTISMTTDRKGKPCIGFITNDSLYVATRRRSL
jgi:hypothetical protein